MGLKPIVLKGEQKRVLFLQVNDPIQIKGVAGSGKTTVALYRAKHLLDTQSNLFQEAKVVIFTYNKTLVKYIKAITPYISGGYQKDSDEIKPKSAAGLNVITTNFHKWAYSFLKERGYRLYEDNRFLSNADQFSIISSLKEKYKPVNPFLNLFEKKEEFFIEEISWMKGKLFLSKEEYIDGKRVGRGTTDRITKSDKEIIWSIFTDYNSTLISRNKIDFDDYAILVIKEIDNDAKFIPPFTHLIIDEAQDLNKAQIIALSKIVSDETKSISIIADAAQRIYKSGFSWSEVGLNVRGARTIEFKKNYRNTVQIARAALSLLEKEDDKSEFTKVETARKGEHKPVVGYFENWEEQVKYLNIQLDALKANNELGSTVILHRSHSGLRRLREHLKPSYSVELLNTSDEINFESDAIKLCTLSSIKGLEFENVFIIDMNDDVIPYPDGFIDENDEVHISTERRLLYTAMTRAREKLFLLCSSKPSRYINEIDESLVDVV